jgi:glycosyltransferase involved in cell wall biosynthesis
MKIVYHYRSCADGAEGIHIYEIINAFKKLNHDVIPVSLVRFEEADKEEADKEDVFKKSRFWQRIRNCIPKIFYEFTELMYNLVGYKMLSNAIKKSQPDFIYERYSLYTFAGIMVSKIKKIPIILEVNSPIAYERKLYEKLFLPFGEHLEKWILSQATKVIVVSHSLKKHFVKRGLNPNKIYVLPNGVDLEKFNPNIPSINLHQKYRINKKKIILGFSGCVRNWHNLELILDILKEERFKNLVHFIIIGEIHPSIFNSLKEYIKVLSLDNCVTVTGKIPHKLIPEYISGIDIAIQPNATLYSSPMKIFEYMALGKPIIAPKLENIEEILEDKKTALLFIPNNKHSLKETLYNLISDNRLRENLGKNAFQLIKTRKYIWLNNAQSIIEMYNELRR